MEARQPRFMYDTRLSPMARIYLSEVYKYFATPVDCLVDDLYFATLFKTSERQVRNWRAELKEFGYIDEKKNELGRKVTRYAPDINNYVDNTKDIVPVHYTTKEGQRISNTLEAFAYFDGLVEDSKLPRKFKLEIRSFCHIFANSLFDERYYNIKPASVKVVLTEEFYQFVVEHFNINIIFETAMRVMRRFVEIRNLNLYVLTAIANLYQGDWELFTNHPAYQKVMEERRYEN